MFTQAGKQHKNISTPVCLNTYKDNLKTFGFDQCYEKKGDSGTFVTLKYGIAYVKVRCFLRQGTGNFL